MALEEHPDDGRREGMLSDPEQQILTDPALMRALSHPVRISLLEVLGIEGQLTATEAGELIGESSTTCSFHLRQLAKYGFVEEAGGGKGRARPWKRTYRGVSFSTTHDDPATEVAAESLGRLFQERQLRRLQTWLSTSHTYPEGWRESASASEFVMWMTPDELMKLNVRLFEELSTKYRDRATDPSARPEDALPVEYLLYSYPIRPVKGDQS